MQDISRRRFLTGIAAAAAGVVVLPSLLGASQAPSVKIRKPNFVFIFGDDIGWGDLGVYGNKSIKTPNLDRFAMNGMLFTQFYVNSPVCSPSRAAFMTGQFPAKLKIHGHFADSAQNKKRSMPNWLDPSVPTVTRLLHSAGYATGHFGKWHLGNGSGAPEPADYGIEDYRIYKGNGPTWEGAKNPESKGSTSFIPKSSELIVDEAMRFVEKNQDKPFYVNVWLKDNHSYLAPTDEQKEPYKKLGGALEIYYAALTNADVHIGRLLKKLDELKLADNTVVVFSSDNGPEDIHIENASHSGVGSAGPFRGRKRSLYDGGIHMPFIVSWPNHIPAGKVDNTSVISGVDWLPTICSLAGVKVPSNLNLDGEDMSSAWLGKPKQRNKPLMWEWRFGIYGDVINVSPALAMRENKWKLLMNPDKSRIELYDLSTNPGEVDNLADRFPDVVTKMSKQLLQWHNSLPDIKTMPPSAGLLEYPWPK